MQTSYPKSLLTLIILLLLLAVISLATPFLSAFGINPAQRPAGALPQNGNVRPQNGTPPQGDGNFQPGNFPQRPGGMFNLFGIARSLGLGGQAMIYVNYGVAVIGAGLSGLAAWWIWKKKKAGLNLALVLAIVFLLGALPGVFSGLRWMSVASILRYALNLLSGAAALVILAITILPSVREEVA